MELADTFFVSLSTCLFWITLTASAVHVAQYFPTLSHRRYVDKRAEIEKSENCSLVEFAGSYKTMGIHKVEGGIRYIEWAPNAVAVNLFGDFSTCASPIA